MFICWYFLSIISNKPCGHVASACGLLCAKDANRRKLCDLPFGALSGTLANLPSKGSRSSTKGFPFIQKTIHQKNHNKHHKITSLIFIINSRNFEISWLFPLVSFRTHCSCLGYRPQTPSHYRVLTFSAGKQQIADEDDGRGDISASPVGEFSRHHLEVMSSTTNMTSMRSAHT